MKNELYGSENIESCRRLDHKLKTAWSDKTPLKVNIICVTCSDAQRRSVYVAYGEPEKSWGAWRPRENREPVLESA